VLVKREIKERREAGYGDRLGFHAFTSADYFRFLMVRRSPPSCFVRSHESEHSGQLAGHDCPFPLLAFCRWGEHGGRPVADGKIELDPADRGVAGPASRPLARTTTAGRIQAGGSGSPRQIRPSRLSCESLHIFAKCVAFADQCRRRAVFDESSCGHGIVLVSVPDDMLIYLCFFDHLALCSGA